MLKDFKLFLLKAIVETKSPLDSFIQLFKLQDIDHTRVHCIECIDLYRFVQVALLSRNILKIDNSNRRSEPC